MMAGEWENTEIEFQHVVIPAADASKHGFVFGIYSISQVDLNFDGQNDLLIREGFSSGSGGTFIDYRAIVWEEGEEAFARYPSFPEMANFPEVNEKRIINRYRLGWEGEVVCEYGVVDGEYVKTREAEWRFKPDGTSMLSYYEMGVLIEQHDVTGLDRDEVAAYYPDLDFWMWG